MKMGGEGVARAVEGEVAGDQVVDPHPVHLQLLPPLPPKVNDLDHRVIVLAPWMNLNGGMKSLLQSLR